MLKGFHEEQEPRNFVCADCIHWKREQGSSWGICENRRVLDGVQHEHFLSTQQNFGCRYQEERQ